MSHCYLIGCLYHVSFDATSRGFCCVKIAEGIVPYVDIVEGNILWSLDTLVSVGRNILWNLFNVDNQC